ncbi:LuxR C-terminal-related transcriptional regulator [Streptomyces erythrochromogenes]|uniref:LuxR C-terminal-related transcriptional regulator n=1 Tax=Streptomyces erythrochromogenes TaxID=285574 RepID=UPI0036F6F3FB
MSVTLDQEELDQTVYEEVLARPELGLVELADRLGVEPGRIRDCLDRLFALRLVQASFETPGRFTVVDPVLGMQRLLDQQHEELVRRHRRAADHQQALVRILAGAGSGSGGRPAEGVERLAGLDAVQRRLERLALEARTEVLTFMPGGPQSAAALEAAERNDALVLGRGVAIRTIGLDLVREDPGTLRYSRALLAGGGSFRTVAALPTRMVLVDRTHALVPIDPADSRQGALSLSAPGMIAPLVALFEREWGTAVPLGADPSEAVYVPTEQERSLLGLLAEGHTDESAAGQLHISARTARRIMASLIERLGARSRFEAGLRAARLGWV